MGLHIEMPFNPELNMQTQEIEFFRKLEKEVHPEIVFNNSQAIMSVYGVEEKQKNDKKSQYCKKTSFVKNT